MPDKLTYISLFSNAGIGCYGFKQAGFECIATNEILEERMKFQQFNHKCKYESGYICNDITLESTKDEIYAEIDLWKRHENLKDVDIVISTPPCQGMSIANHKKKNELPRNSLVVESLLITQKINPKFFVLENVRNFLKAECLDTDGILKKIQFAIENNLGNYNITYNVVNFSEYGSPSNRTRTLVLGVRKDIKDISPLDIFPEKERPLTLRESIGDMESLTTLGEISPDDIFHNFRPYPERMEVWIKDLREGQSAFDQNDIRKKPHQIKNGEVIVNKNKNRDKYSRCFWGRPGYCIHTRNDQLASQKTIHPRDNRVFSIREVMHLMSVPDSFLWSDIPPRKLNSLTDDEKKVFLKKNELNIRRTLGEAVPTIVFRKIADKVMGTVSGKRLSDKEIGVIIYNHELEVPEKLYRFLKKKLNTLSFNELSRIAELANAMRLHNSAYYTPQGICYTLICDLPDFEKLNTISILEPSVGAGNFLPLLIEKYKDKKSVSVDIVDIDKDMLKVLKLLLEKLNPPENFNFNFIHADFLSESTCFCKEYNLVIGNPPFKKLTNNKELLTQYKSDAYNSRTNNLFSFFIEKALKIGDHVAFILPKTLLSSPEYNKTREFLNNFRICKICDYGEKAFNIKIETIGLIIQTSGQHDDKLNAIKIESYISNRVFFLRQGYVTDEGYPYWLIYRNSYFDSVAKELIFDIFSVYRDRQITNKILSGNGAYRVLKSRNIGDNQIIDKAGYDCYINSIENLSVSRFLDQSKVVLIPNLTYNPRACFLPSGAIADGSVAFAKAKNGHKITKRNLAFYATDKFRRFYKIARNNSSRSMNIDSNSIFFFGLTGGK